MLRLFLEGLLDLLWPPRTTCLLCEAWLETGVTTAGPGANANGSGAGGPQAPEVSLADRLPVCPACWGSMAFAPGEECCTHCNRPLLRDRGICRECAESPPFGRVWALGLHRGALREAIHHLKFGGRRALGAALGQRLAGQVPEEYELIVPLPLHSSRLRERGYNQAALIGQGLSDRLHLPMADGALVRLRPTGHQAKLDREERLRNLRGAFGLHRQISIPWCGRAVLLVDDVLTTGATASAAAEVLRRTGAIRVDLAVLAVSDKPVAPALPPGRERLPGPAVR